MNLDPQLFAALLGALVAGVLALFAQLMSMMQTRRRHNRQQVAELSAALAGVREGLDLTDQRVARQLADRTKVPLMRALPWMGGRVSQSLFLACVQSSNASLQAWDRRYSQALMSGNGVVQIEFKQSIIDYVVSLERLSSLLVMRHPITVSMAWGRDVEALSSRLPEQLRFSPYPSLWKATMVRTWWEERTLWRGFVGAICKATFARKPKTDDSSSSPDPA